MNQYPLTMTSMFPRVNASKVGRSGELSIVLFVAYSILKVISSLWCFFFQLSTTYIHLTRHFFLRIIIEFKFLFVCAGQWFVAWYVWHKNWSKYLTCQPLKGMIFTAWMALPSAYNLWNLTCQRLMTLSDFHISVWLSCGSSCPSV